MISEKRRQLSNTALIIRTSAGGLAIILAGYVVAKTGDSLGRQTGVGSGMIGLILGGISTSLPELSTTLAAVRLRQYEMAFSEVFGTNLFSVMLLFFVDLAYPGNAILNETGSFEVFSVLLGIALTGIYLAGLIVRRNVTVVRMGVDSLLVILTYLGGVILLYGLGGRPI